MNKKLLLALTSALYGASLGAVAFSANSVTTDSNDLKLIAAQPVNTKSTKSFVKPKLSEKFKIEKNISGEHLYIIRLEDPAIANYRGGIKGYAATSPAYTKSLKEKMQLINQNYSASQNRATLKLDMKSAEVKHYSKYLDSKQSNFIAKSSKLLGKNIQPVSQIKTALNAVFVRLTQEQAIKLANLPEVAFVERDRLLELNTDAGPKLIGAPNVWDGTATGVGNYGEGTIVGIIDTGINTDNISFADVGGDGYDHTNPYGAGVYKGDCANGFPQLCNDKLIGVYSYSTITDVYSDASVFGANPPAANGEDYNGHGSHTAGTAAGNVLVNVPMLDQEVGKEEGDGVNSTGFSFDKISGVAPHANIISYQVCWPGNSTSTRRDTYVACPTSVSISAVNDAIRDGVDTLNFSIGGGGAWQSSGERAFLNAQQAGIFVATSAGNSGPTASTAKGAPWYTSVAASTHGRTVEFAKTIGTFTGGDTTVPSDINGSSATAGITAPIVYAGDFANSNAPAGEDTAQCLTAFPAGTFSGQIVVCDRGSIARVDKASNAAAGGAGGFVLANVDGGASSLANDVFVVPGIHISAADGNVLKTWLKTGADHTATISAASGEIVIGQADDLAGFSSRGPNADVPDVMTPSVAAPGVSIYAAYADQHFGHDVLGPDPADFAFLQGTSMASPHVAGAGALLKAVHPTWTADNIRSALMLTATSEMRKEDGTTPADLFDMGSGRIRVDLAAKTGLVMNETFDNYVAANPADGGDPKTLNLPSMGNTACQGSCSWQRTFTATKDGDWTVSATSSSDKAVITMSPETFSLTAGQTQTVTITATINGLRTGDKVTGKVTLTASDTSIPEANLPLFLTVNTSNIPSKLDMEVHRSAGSVVLRNNLALEISKFTPRVFGLTKADASVLEVGLDSDNSSAFDDITDGQVLTWVNITQDTPFFYVGISNAESPDLDLRVGRDENGDGVPERGEMVCQSATVATNEVCEIEELPAGNYWILVQNWAASAPDAKDKFTLQTAYVGNENSNNMSLVAQESVDSFTPFDIRMNWDADMAEGDIFVGMFDVATDAEEANAGNLGSTAMVIKRGADDVSMAVDNDNPAVGDTVTYTISLLANMTDEDASYNITANVPKGVTIDPDSVTASTGTASVISGGIDGVNIQWSATREGLKGAEPSYITTSNATDASCAIPFGSGGYVDLAGFGIGFNSLDGDAQAGQYNISGQFLGKPFSSFIVTDDGFVTVGGSTGSSAWKNQHFPSTDQPNAVMAPLWRDMQLDKANGSGISVATAGATLTIIEFDKMRHYNYYNGQAAVDDVLDFEIVLHNTTGNIYYAYNNVTHNFGNAIPTTVGWENATGTNGANVVYRGSGGSPAGSVTDITSGLVLCHTLQAPDSSPATVTFTGTVDATAAGATLVNPVTSTSTNINSKEEMSYVNVKVKSNLAITEIADAEIAEDTTLTGVIVEFTDAEATENTITVTSDNGVASNISGNTSGSTFDITPNADFNGTMVVTVTVTDNQVSTDSVSTSFNVNVTPVNDAPTVTATASQSFVNTVSTISLKAVGNDVDGDDLTYSWTQVSGPSVTITDADKANATVNNANTESGTLVFEVTVSDAETSGKTTVSVDVNKSDTGSAGSMAWLLLMLTAVGIRRRRN